VERTDEDILADVEQALLSDPATELYEVRVRVKDTVVTLNGTVQSWPEKELASDVAMGVKGVKGVENEILIEYPEERSDLEIQKDVEAQLRSDVWVDDFLIEVTVKDGKVFLMGSVGSAQEKRWAMADAWVMGVTNVDAGQLEIKWWLKDDEKRKDKVVLKGDQEIEDAIYDALVYDPRVKVTDIAIAVENGIVTLTGTVDNLEAKISAAEDASNTTGVLRVKNYIRTRPNELFIDEELVKRVNDALIRDPYTEIFDIVVTAFNGRVFLHGRVNNLFEKEHAEDVAQRVSGVVEVINNIEYKPATVSKSDWELKQDITNGLFWNPNINEKDIFVFVENGEVTLSGEVATLNQRMTAEDIAYNAGADWVNNQIGVKGLPQINPEKPTR
jgi:osmotically-inducible protein OsmY